MLYVWLSLLALLVLFTLTATLTAGIPILFALVPVAGLAVYFVLAHGIWLYWNTPERMTRRIAQEMELLFGEGWEGSVDTNTYAFALSRVRMRYQERKDFLIHLLLFIPGSLYLALLGFVGFISREPGIIIISAILLIWLPLFIRHARNAFPGRDRLIRREREAWETLQLHLNQLKPDKPKRKEKPKRETRYHLSDDGELVEESEPLDWWDQQPNSDTNAST
jgi:hypothetical protein